MGQNEIQRAGLNAILRKTLTIKGDVPPSNVIGAEIIPILVLENDRPEWLFLAGERRAFAEINVLPVAGQHSIGIIEVPTGSNMLVVVERITVQLTGSAVFEERMGSNNIGLGAFAGGVAPVEQTTYATDTRWPDGFGIQAGSTVRAYAANSAAGLGGNFMADLDIPGNYPLDFCDRHGPWVMTPGFKLGVQVQQLNTGACILFQWRERAMEPSEPSSRNP